MSATVEDPGLVTESRTQPRCFHGAEGQLAWVVREREVVLGATVTA